MSGFAQKHTGRVITLPFIAQSQNGFMLIKSVSSSHHKTKNPDQFGRGFLVSDPGISLKRNPG